MKKRVKKLVLAKETVSRLEDAKLVEAAGATGHSCSEHDRYFCFIMPDTHSC